MPSDGSAATPAGSVPHLAARAEDAFHSFRERRGLRRGRIPTVLPFTGYGGDGWIRVLCRVVLTKPASSRKPDASPAMPSLRGWRSFTSAPVRDAAVQVEAGGVIHELTADRGGVVDERIDARLPSGWNTIRLRVNDGPAVETQVFVVASDVAFGLVSDIDDTVMVTALPRPFLAAWNTFVLDEHARQPVPGMAVLYERLLRAHPGAPVFYVSTGAWNVVPTLTRFLGRNLYPAGTLLLTDWGPTHDRWFRSGQLHKRVTLKRLREEFPRMSWLLVGDDGQHDREIYGEFAAQHPDRVAAIVIRNLTPTQAVLAGGRSLADGDGDIPQVSAYDGAGLSEKLGELGLL